MYLHNELGLSMLKLSKVRTSQRDKHTERCVWKHYHTAPAGSTKLENVAIANALQLEAARDTPAHCRFDYDTNHTMPLWCRRTYPLPYYSVFAADKLLYDVTLTSDSVTLTFDLWPWTFAAYRLWRDETLYQIWTQSNNPRRSYCHFSVWPYDLEHVLSVALGSRIIFTTFDLRQLIVFLCWYNRSRCDLELWPTDLESSWYIKRHVFKVYTKFERNRAIPGWSIDNFAYFCIRYVTLTFDFLTLNF